MKLFLSVFVSLFAFTAMADNHSDDELAVLESLNAYYDARRNEDWKKVVSMEKVITLLELRNVLFSQKLILINLIRCVG